MELATIDDRLSQLLGENFTTEDQQLFVDSFKTYLQYGDDDTAFVIDLNDVWEWVGFSKLSNAKRLLKAKFCLETDYKILLLRWEQDDHHGGHNKERVLMTVNCFKKFCIKASTAKGDQVCDYYLKMERVMQKYIKESMEAAQQQLNETRHALENERHHVLKQAYHKKSLVYVLRVHDVADGFIIKIGETTDIKGRLSKISSSFGCPVKVLDVFQCEESHAFEQLLHSELLIKYKYTGLVNDIAKCTEVYFMKDMDMYAKIKRIIENNIYKFNVKAEHLAKTLELRDKELQILLSDMIRNDRETYDILITDLKALKGEHSKQPINIAPTPENEPSTNTPIPVQQPHTIGPYVQMYDGHDHTKLLKVFNSYVEVERAVRGTSLTGLKFAARNKVMYMGYRWFLIDRNDSLPNTARPIGETVPSMQKRSGFVAKLDLEKTSVQEVFLRQKDAAESIGQHPSAICTAIKFGQLFQCAFWVCWDDLDQALQDAYLANNQLPVRTSVPRGVQITQRDPVTKAVIKTFTTINDIKKEFRVSPKLVKNACVSQEIMKGYLWSFAPT
jgi:hypothetical protein